jgi:PadR family transcriptional regulator PadR
MTGKNRYDDPTESRRAQMLKGVAELALLSLLRDRPHFGLEILERLHRDAGVMLAEGGLYPLLHRLEKAGLTRAEWRLDEDGARPRKYYTLTEAGRSELQAQAADWRALSASLTNFIDRTTP